MNPALALVAIAVTVVITSFISGILGMAGGMILMGVLLLLMPVPAAMMLHGITQMASNPATRSDSNPVGFTPPR